MPKYSVIVTITKDLVCDADNAREASKLARRHAEDFLESADTPEVHEPSEVNDDYESVTDDQID